MVKTLSEALKEYTQKTERFSNDIYFPVESQSAFKFAGFLFGSIPFSHYYEGVAYNLLKKIFVNLDFMEIFKDDKFDRDINKNITNSQIFVSLKYKSVIYVKIGDKIDNNIHVLTDFREFTDNDIDDNVVCVYHFFEKDLDAVFLDLLTDRLKNAALADFKLKAKKNSINFLCHDHCFRLKNVKVKRKVESNLELNYGADFTKIYDHLMKFLESDDTGLAILHGHAGCGKTFFIRHLLSVLSKRVIYIPPHLVSKIAEPDFLGFLLNERDFILVIEDAEEIITDRKDTNNTAGVSNLLNLSDGILGDCIKIKVIVTFNCDIKDIDPALLRKGRLKLKHEFKKLDIETSNKLLKHLNIDYITKEPMSVGDLYNFKDNNFKEEKVVPKIGFGK